MKRLKKKRALKGFTLMEVVISIAVFAIAAALLVEAGLSVIYNVRSSRNLVKKVNYQSKILAARPDGTTSDMVNPVSGATFNISLATEDGLASGSLTVNGYEAKTETKKIDDGAGGEIEVPAYDDVAGNLKYFVND